MAKNTSISLGDHFNKFVKDQVNSGRYATTSDVVRTSLRLLEEHEEEHAAKLQRVRQLLIDAENSGPLQEFDFVAFRERKRVELQKNSA